MSRREQSYWATTAMGQGFAGSEHRRDNGHTYFPTVVATAAINGAAAAEQHPSAELSPDLAVGQDVEAIAEPAETDF